MTFALPIALTLSALALPIIVLYILKVRLRRVPVSTNLFWKQIWEEKPPRSIWQHFRHLLSLLLQLLLLLLIVLAVADPYFSWQLLQARRMVIVVDNSASMRAADVASSRLEAARAAALDEVAGLRFRDEVAIVLAGSNPEVIVGMTGHAPTLRNAINGIQVSDNPTQIDSAIRLGQQLIGNHPHGQMIVMTDGCVDMKQVAERSPAFDKSRASEQVTAPVEYRLFSSDAANIGITQLQVRRSLTDPLGYEILASVKNASAAAVACRLELTLNDIPVDVIPLSLKPEELWSRSIEKTSLEGGRLRGVLTQIHADETPESGRVGQARKASDGPPESASANMVGRRGFSAAGPTLLENRTDGANLSELNTLTTDDSAWALLPSRSTQQVLIVTAGNLFLQKVFEANPLVEVTIRKDFPPAEQWPADSIIVLHGTVPATIPPGNVFVVDPVGSCDLWDQGAVLENPIVTEQDKTSPLMNHIRLDNVLVPEARALQFRTPPHSLAKTLSGEIVYADVRRPNGKCLVLSVNLDRSDLAFRTAFPIMVANSLGWFAGQTGELQEALATGSMTTVMLEKSLNPDAQASQPPAESSLANGTSRADFLLTSPSGVTSSVITDVADSGLTNGSDTADPNNAEPISAIIGPLNEVGIWSVKAHSSFVSPAESSDSRVISEVAVNLASERETDLRPLKELVDSPQTKITSAGWFSNPFWFYLIIVASVLTSLEWFLYQRRLIS